MEEETKKWVLSHGIHRGTITSRDSGMPESFDTRQAAMEYFYNQRRFYRSIGYVIWFANLTSPEGTTESLESNPYYER